ncbi:hypothetical protein AURDEDRAFT_170880 [Auricularia subglabra TFB-10046 SS5]|nr:hypothetical protein AURDEDRAFT_170880 [Auricularia subglabra TFB-10046 SS5]
MKINSATRVLQSVDLLTTILDGPNQQREAARLASLSRQINASVNTAQQHMFHPFILLRKFFSTEAIDEVKDIINQYHVILTGSGILHFLSRARDPTSLVMLVPDYALDVVSEFLLLRGHTLLHDVPPNMIHRAGSDSSEETEYAPFARQMLFCYQNRVIWLCVPRYTVMHGVLHQRSTLFMHGLSSSGFFSLYPSAAFTTGVGTLTHGPIPSRMPLYIANQPYADLSIGGYRTWTQGISRFHRPFMTGHRRFGDGMCLLIPHPFMGGADQKFTSLRAHTWSIADRTFYGRTDITNNNITQKMVCTRVVSSPLLTRQYIASAACKAFLCRVLDTVEVSDNGSIQWDSEIIRMVDSFENNSAYHVTVRGRQMSFSLVRAAMYT